MTAYALSLVEVTDPVTFGAYVDKVGSVVERYGGRYVSVGPVAEVLEGVPGPTSVVLVSFDDLDTARRWYRSDDYQAIVPVRHRSAVTTMILYEDQ